jgi:hypothetical protein
MCDMKKRPSDNKYGLFALALAAFAAAGTAPALAQSSGTWSAGISGRSGTPYVHTQSTNLQNSTALAFAQIPALFLVLFLRSTHRTVRRGYSRATYQECDEENEKAARA